MLRWLQAFVHRELVYDVPAEMSLCLECGKLVCSENEFRDCERRKERAAELALPAHGDFRRSAEASD